jgi:hypothetical protein
MFDPENDGELIAEIEGTYQSRGLYEHGLPLGFGYFDITTNSEPLNAFLWSFKKIVQARKDGIEAEELRTDENYHEFLKLLQDMKSGENNSEWKLVNHWATRGAWRGPNNREVSIFRNKKTGAYKHQIRSFRETIARGRLLITSSLIRSKCNIVETERVAQGRLFEELNEEQKRQYLLADSFTETGKSGVLYLLRRNRPTLAVRLTEKEDGHEGDILCALCMHPLAYYTESWAGVMPPSDEILAHLLHIRANEHRYWKICNQHSPSDYLSGL